MKLSTVVVLSFALVSTLAISEQPAVESTSGAWRASDRKLLEKGSPTTVNGTVLSTRQFKSEDGAEPGLEMKVATGSGDLTIQLGPRWFIMQNDFNFTRGEPVSIVGIKIRIDDKPVVVATEVAKDDKKLILREPATGKPKWLETGK